MMDFYVYKMRLAGYLMMRGHKLLRLEPSRKCPGMDVYVFRFSQSLHDSISAYHHG